MGRAGRSLPTQTPLHRAWPACFQKPENKHTYQAIFHLSSQDVIVGGSARQCAVCERASQAASRRGFMVTYLPAECLKTVPGGRVLLKPCCVKSVQATRSRECSFLGPGEAPVVEIIALHTRVRLDGVGGSSGTFALLDSHDDTGGGRPSRHGETEVQRGPSLLREGVGVRCSSKV